MTDYLLFDALPLFISAVIFALLMTPLMKRLSKRLGFLDLPGDRKVHLEPMPLLGGVALFVSFISCLMAHLPPSSTLLGVLLGSLIIVSVGVLDDKWTLSPFVKLSGQVAAAIVTVYFGIQIQFVSNPIEGGFIYLGLFSHVISVLWLVGMMTIFNLIDGLDGLSAGVAAISAIFLAIFALMTGQLMAASMAIALCGVCLGFLRYNFYPASIFMGDSGALFLGYILGVISIVGVLKSTAIVSLGVPLIVFGLPLSDTILAIYRRIRNKKAIYLPDREHIHHKLLQKGLSHRQSTLVLYVLSLVFGFLAFMISELAPILTLGFILGGILLFWAMKKRTKRTLKRFFSPFFS